MSYESLFGPKIRLCVKKNNITWFMNIMTDISSQLIFSTKVIEYVFFVVLLNSLGSSLIRLPLAKCDLSEVLGDERAL